VSAAVTLSAAGGEVTADDGYRRTLAPAESAALLADAYAALAAVASQDSASRSGSPDAFRLEITLIADDSRAVVVRSDDASVAAIPAAARLNEWGAREADAIVRRRFEP